MKILVFGNPLLQKDNLALRILPRLKKEFSKNNELEFIESDSTEDLHKQGRNLVILDVAMDIQKVEIIEELDRLTTGKMYTLHDFDLPNNLKIFKKLNLIDSVKIIAIPQDLDEDVAFEEVCEVLRKI